MSFPKSTKSTLKKRKLSRRLKVGEMSEHGQICNRELAKMVKSVLRKYYRTPDQKSAHYDIIQELGK